MTARRLILPAALAGLLAAPGCFRANDPEQAPAPRAKKTQAELLVGTWQQTKFGKGLPGATVIYEFTEDGKFIGRVSTPPQLRTGTYELHGNVLVFNAVATPEEPAERAELVIEQLTETELVTGVRPPDERLRAVYKRLEKK